jgi:hypothetical protein
MPPKKPKKKPSQKKPAKKSQGALEDEQLDDVAGGIDTVPLPERTPGTFDRVVKKKTTFTRPEI